MSLVAVIPAAGFGTRLQPIAGSKELVPVAGRPMMDYLLERIARADVDEIRVVTRPEKVDVIGHARQLGGTVVTGRPTTLAESFLLGITGLNRDDTVLFGFPDSVWSPTDGFVHVLDLHRRHPEGIALGLFQIDEPERMEVATFEADGRVSSVEFRPQRPSSTWGWGCLAADVRALVGLVQHAEPGFLLDQEARAGRVWGVPLGRYVDMGTRSALEAALLDPILTER